MSAGETICKKLKISHYLVKLRAHFLNNKYRMLTTVDVQLSMHIANMQISN